jgi:hypothetical protein
MSQTFDMTFELSAHDMFVACQNGACVCCPIAKQLIKPGAFINDARLTFCFSVPSTAVFIRRFGVLKPGMYPGLRLSLFCGEVLPAEGAQQWALAAPNSAIENSHTLREKEQVTASAEHRCRPVATHPNELYQPELVIRNVS